MDYNIKKLEDDLNKIVQTDSNMSLQNNKLLAPFFQKYGIYIILFIYILIVVICIRPKILYKYDNEKQKEIFLYKRYIFVSIIIFVLLLGIILVWNYIFTKEYKLL